ncbi:MAG: helix-turn-helix transcriptional regulator [Pseudonocardiaceae bacterium]
MIGKRRVLAERRKVVGYSQERLALALGVERSTVMRWEAGETTPQPWCRPRLAKALDVSLDELDVMLAEGQPEGRSGQLRDTGTPDELPIDPEHDPVLTTPWSHRGTVEVAVLLGGGGGMKRRNFVFLSGMALTAPAHQWLIQDPGPLVSGLSGRRVSAELADRLPPMITELRTMDDVAGGGTVLSLAQHEFGWVAGLLDQASYDEPTGRKLHVALAELGQLAGWAAHDAGHQALAQRYYLAGLRVAHTADDRPLGAHILGCMALQAVDDGRPAEAVTLIQTAFAGIRGREAPRLLCELHIREARAFGTMQDASACTTAVSKARSHVEPQDNDPPWLYWVSPADITASAGSCLLRLGDSERAVALFEEGMGLFDESFVRDRQHFSIRLAQALAHPGQQRDLDAAASRGIEAITMAENLDSSLSTGLLRDLCDQMTPHATVPSVGDFLERARGLVTV